MRGRLRAYAKRVVRGLAGPYLRQRAREEARTAAAVERVQAELEHVSERHDEQIARLEDLVRELIATAESLRRELIDMSERAAFKDALSGPTAPHTPPAATPHAEEPQD